MNQTDTMHGPPRAGSPLDQIQQFSLLIVGGAQFAAGYQTINEEGYITPALINSAFGSIGLMLGLQ